jgi:DNA-binding MarR family transcriptional regulator
VTDVSVHFHASHPRTAPAPDLTEIADYWSTIRRIIGRSEQVCLDAGTTNLQFQALLTIAACEGQVLPTVTDLAERLVLRHNSAVELSTRLEAAGWITRTRCPSNRRKVLLALTDAGRDLVQQLVSIHGRLAPAADLPQT